MRVDAPGQQEFPAQVVVRGLREGPLRFAGGVFRGQSGYALGISTTTDSGKWVFKASASGNSQGHFGAGAGAAYIW